MIHCSGEGPPFCCVRCACPTSMLTRTNSESNDLTSASNGAGLQSRMFYSTHQGAAHLAGQADHFIKRIRAPAGRLVSSRAGHLGMCDQRVSSRTGCGPPCAWPQLGKFRPRFRRATVTARTAGSLAMMNPQELDRECEATRRNPRLRFLILAACAFQSPSSTRCDTASLKFQVASGHQPLRRAPAAKEGMAAAAGAGTFWIWTA
jgi:hypothetical protein